LGKIIQELLVILMAKIRGSKKDLPEQNLVRILSENWLAPLKKA